jgi:type IV pilus assembly protein PilA
MYFALMGKLSARRQDLAQDKDKGFTLIELLVVVIIIGIQTQTGKLPAAADVSTLTADMKSAGATLGTDTKSMSLTANGTTGFCIQGTSSTTKTFAATEVNGVAAGTCNADGTFKPTP